jgi:putative redox protein
MSQTLGIHVEQIGTSTAKGVARTHSVIVDRPLAKGGTDRGPLGGEYLLIALGGCFMSNLLAASQARGGSLSNISIAVKATMDGTPERFTDFELTVSARHDDSSVARKLIAIADRACAVTNTLRRAAPVAVIFEGSRIDSAVETVT